MAQRGRIYLKHPKIYRVCPACGNQLIMSIMQYSADNNDKAWLIQRGLMTRAAGKAYLLIAEDIVQVAEGCARAHQARAVRWFDAIGRGDAGADPANAQEPGLARRESAIPDRFVCRIRDAAVVRCALASAAAGRTQVSAPRDRREPHVQREG